MRVWVERVGFTGNASSSVQLEAVLARGVELVEFDHACAWSVGLLLFDPVAPELYDRIQQLSERGSRRVLALAVRSEHLPRTAVWRLLEAGASAVLAWDALDDPAASVAAQLARWCEIEDLIDSPTVSGHLVGQSPVWRATLRLVIELARFTTVPILITGATGTGKELVARLIHAIDPRPSRRELVLVDCTTIAPELAGSEFFGHERGAFTHAIASRDGAFALADGGTLFLDEVGELPPRLQAELLRVVQEGTYKRVGSNEWRRTSFRLVCATNRDLDHERARGSFRDDLYHRLAGGVCHLPALEKRRADIPLLVEHFLRAHFDGRTPPRVDPAVRDCLMTREYPGNLRELRQLVARLACYHVEPGPLGVGSIPADERPTSRLVGDAWSDDRLELTVRTALARGESVEDLRNSVAQMAYRIALEDAAGNTSLAADRLGVSMRAVQMYRKGSRGALGERVEP